jgi:SSS family solute:Na+ symporter
MDISSLDITSNFSAIDWAVVAVYLAGTVLIGLYVNRYVSNMADFVVAGRSLNTWIAVATMIGSELGLVTVMFAAQTGFSHGFAAFHIPLVAGAVTLMVGLTGFIVVPLRQMGVMTIPEFYERRFGRDVRIFGGLILVLAGLLNMGLFLRAGALFISGLTGMTSDVEIKLLMTALLGLVLFYTILGGMISVVITDYIQFVVLAFGMLLACWFAVDRLGWSNIVETVKAQSGAGGFNPFLDESVGWEYVIWQLFTAGLVSCAIWQTAVMRACSAESVAVVKRLYRFSSIGFLIRFLVPQFLGICAFVFIIQQTSHQALFIGEGADSDLTLQAMPLFLSQLLPAGVIGLIAAGMLAGFMSTHDSYLLCWSSVLTQDVIAPLMGDRLSVKGRLLLTRISVAVMGVFLLIWGLWYPLENDLWDYMAVTGAIYFTGAFALLLFGLYWRGASRFGAFLALNCGLGAVFGLPPVQSAFGVTAILSGAKVGLMVTVGCLVAMLVGSFWVPDRNSLHDSARMERTS